MNWEEIFSFYELKNTFDYFVYTYLIFFLLEVILYILVFGKVAFFNFKKDKKLNKQYQPVSIIICARNERENLLNHLPKFLSQDYPEFEVIVVNDNSIDDTEEVLKAFSYQYKNLKIVNVPDNDKFFGSKKFALTLGIKAANYDTVLLSDADCFPASEEWIKLMMEAKTRKIVLGYGKYQEQNGFLNKVIRFETVYTAIQYFGLAMLKLPYMGVGRNLLYNKKLFFDNKGFASHYQILSGDDDLFINEVANKTNTTVQFHPKAHTVSIPKTTWKSWWTQKKRHLTTGKHYQFIHKVVLALIYFIQLMFILNFILLICFNHSIYLILGVYLLKMSLQLITFNCAFRRLNEKGMTILTPVLELFILIVIPILLISNKITKITKWN